MSKESNLYHELCLITIKIMKDQRQSDLVQNIIMSIDNNMGSRLKYYINQYRKTIENQNDDEIFKSLI